MTNLSELLSTCNLVFGTVSKTTSTFVPFLFVFRIVGANILGEGFRVFSILKSLVVYFVLVAIFPPILEILFSIPESFLPNLSSSRATDTSGPDWHDASILPFTLDRILETILSLIYWLAYYLHGFLMILMCSMAPIVFLASTLMGLGLGIELFFGLLVISSSWPIIWFGFDQVHDVLASAQKDAFGAKCLELLLTVLKGLTPLAFGSVIIKSPPGRAATDSVRLATRVTGWGTGKVQSGYQFVRSLTSKETKKSQSTSTQTKAGEAATPNTKRNSDSDDRLKKAKDRNPRSARPHHKKERTMK